MTTRRFADLHPVAGSGVHAWRSAAPRIRTLLTYLTVRTLRTPVGRHADLGPFVVRRFVDFARTESMMCRMSA
jgi:hypothetical protein